jgi:hypothetical protein
MSDPLAPTGPELGTVPIGSLATLILVVDCGPFSD